MPGQGEEQPGGPGKKHYEGQSRRPPLPQPGRREVDEPVMQRRVIEIGQRQVTGAGQGIGLVDPQPQGRGDQQTKNQEEPDQGQDHPLRMGKVSA